MIIFRVQSIINGLERVYELKYEPPLASGIYTKCKATEHRHGSNKMPVCTNLVLQRRSEWNERSGILGLVQYAEPYFPK